MFFCHNQLRGRCVGAILKQCVFCPWGGIVTLLYIKSTWLIRRYVWWQESKQFLTVIERTATSYPAH